MRDKTAILLFFVSSMVFAQADIDDCATCPPNYECFEGSCIPNSGPPPPGLDVPIDKEIPFAILAGFVIGGAYIYKQRGSKIIPKSF